jgi:hypothetical protein
MTFSPYFFSCKWWRFQSQFKVINHIARKIGLNNNTAYAVVLYYNLPRRFLVDKSIGFFELIFYFLYISLASYTTFYQLFDWSRPLMVLVS